MTPLAKIRSLKGLRSSRRVEWQPKLETQESNSTRNRSRLESDVIVTRRKPDDPRRLAYAKAVSLSVMTVSSAVKDIESWNPVQRDQGCELCNQPRSMMDNT